MSDRDLVQELKSNVVDLTAEKDEMAKTVTKKQARIKQIMIKLEHATDDVKHCGHKIEDQNKEIVSLKAKLETKEKLLQEDGLLHLLKKKNPSIHGPSGTKNRLKI